MRNEKGFIGPEAGKDFLKGFILAMVIAAVIGWAAIEGLIWLVRHIQITWVKP